MKSSPVSHLRFALLAGLACVAFGEAGCTTTRYKDPSGVEFSRTSFLTTQTIAQIKVSTSKEGVRTIDVKGYSNEQAEVAGAVVESAIKAALKP